MRSDQYLTRRPNRPAMEAAVNCIRTPAPASSPINRIVILDPGQPLGMGEHRHIAGGEETEDELVEARRQDVVRAARRENSGSR